MLTTKKRGYADAIMRGENQTQSAISAGYSAVSAKYKGHQLSKDRDVLAYIKRMKHTSEEKASEINAVAPPEPIKTAVVVVENPEVVVSEVAPTPPPLVKTEAIDDPLVVMRRIMNDNLFTDPKLSLDAAAKLAPYVAAKMAETGKKQAKNSAAKKATNAFTSMMPPKLIVNNSV